MEQNEMTVERFKVPVKELLKRIGLSDIYAPPECWRDPVQVKLSLMDGLLYNAHIEFLETIDWLTSVNFRFKMRHLDELDKDIVYDYEPSIKLAVRDFDAQQQQVLISFLAHIGERGRCKELSEAFLQMATDYKQ